MLVCLQSRNRSDIGHKYIDIIPLKCPTRIKIKSELMVLVLKNIFSDFCRLGEYNIGTDMLLR